MENQCPSRCTPRRSRASTAAIFDPYTEYLIQSQAHRVVRQAALPAGDRDDVAQELLLHLWKNTPKYDPVRGKWTTFARCVVQRKATALLTSLRSAGRDLQDTCGGDVEGFTADVYRRRTTVAQVELALDVTRSLRKLAPEDYALARLLMHQRVTDVSRRTGVPRSTLYGRIARIRTQLGDDGLRDYVVGGPTVSEQAE